jgi:hypothetical protein
MIGAFAVSVVLHLVLAAATWRIPFVPRIDPARAAERPDEVEILLVDEADEAADMQRPTAITSIPERLATEQPPERPDFLAEHNAVAADRSGNDGDRPRADEEGPFPQVDITREQLEGAGGVAYSQAPLPDPQEATGSPRTGSEGEDEQRADSEAQQGTGDWIVPAERTEAGGKSEGDRDDEKEAPEKQPDLEDWWGGQAPSVLKEGQQSAVGDRGFEFDQKSMGDLGAGVAIDGDYSLNTYEWDYAPWIRQFANQLHRHWVAPYAYRLGVISGMTRMRMVVEKDGRLSALEIIETDGHESLHDASQAALKAFAPYAPLPPNFPEPNLVIILSLHYPAWRR